MNSLTHNPLNELKARLKLFSDLRDWGQFHSPKNLVMALAGEVGELSEIFQWLTIEESKNISNEKLTDVSNEIADVLLYLIRLSDVLGIDLLDAGFQKIELNEKRYPVDLSKGSSKKYTML